MTRCLARWVIATSLACIWIAEGSATVRADEAQDGALAAPAPILFPFHPAYRSRPPRQPASLPAAAPDSIAAVAETAPAEADRQPLEPDEMPAADPAAGGAEEASQPGAGPDETEGPPDTASEADEVEPPVEIEVPRRELSPAMATLRDRVRSVLAFHRGRALSAGTNSATEIMAACLAFGCRTNVARGDRTGTSINGITQLCWNYPCGGFAPLMMADGHVAARLGYGNQEHQSQLLATLALARVNADYPLRVSEEVLSVADLVEGEKLRCRAEDDLSLTLVGLAYYVTDDATWKNLAGEEWSVERLIREELAKPVVTATDGGLNRLMGLSYAVHRRMKREQPVDGQYLRAEKFVGEFHDYAFRLQNGDGSWGPWFLSAQGASRDSVQNLRGTGHVLEWLSLSLSEEQLEDARIIRSLDYVVKLLSSSRYRRGVASYSTREIDSVMHALHALTIYDERVFQPADPPPAEVEAPVRDGEKVAGRPAA